MRLVLDARLRTHMRHALVEHRRWLRSKASVSPPKLDRLAGGQRHVARVCAPCVSQRGHTSRRC
jgi:hypothetical protein